MSSPVLYFTIPLTFAEAEQRIRRIESINSFGWHSTTLRIIATNPTQTTFKVVKTASRRLTVQVEVALVVLSPTEIEVNIQFITDMTVYLMLAIYIFIFVFMMLLLTAGGTANVIMMIIGVTIGAIITYGVYKYDQQKLLEKITKALTTPETR